MNDSLDNTAENLIYTTTTRQGGLLSYNCASGLSSGYTGDQVAFSAYRLQPLQLLRTCTVGPLPAQ